MTSLAFIAGLLPLLFVSGPAAQGNHSIGAAAIGGMLVGMVLGIFVVPVLFVTFQYLQERITGVASPIVEAGELLEEVLIEEKALVEVPAETAGILGKYLVAEGKNAQVGLPIAVLLSQGEDVSEIDKLLAGVTVAAPVAAPVPVVEVVTTPVVQAAPQQAVPARSGRVFVSPIARKLARELGVDINSVIGTGPDGRIVKADIYAAKSVVGAPAQVVTMNSTEAVPHSRMRKAIARRLTESKTTVPHFYLSAALIADDFLELRKKLNEWTTQKVSVTDLILKTVAAAYSDVPKANCVWGDEAMQFFNTVDIAVAVATENGLVTPVVRGVEKFRLDDLAKTTGDLFGRPGMRRQGHHLRI